MNKLIALIEALENKQENGTITMSEQAIFCKLIEKVEDMLYSN